MVNPQDLFVPVEGLDADCTVVCGPAGVPQVHAATLPDVPIDVLDLALEAASSGPSPPEPFSLCFHMDGDLTPEQYRDLAKWAVSLMPDFGLPSSEHRGLFAHPNALALNARMGVYHTTSWAYEVARWEAQECSCACIVAIRRGYLSAQARVSEAYKVAYYEDDEGIGAYLENIRLMTKLLALTVSMRRNLAPDESIVFS